MTEPKANGADRRAAEDRFMGRIQPTRPSRREYAENVAQSLLKPGQRPRPQQIDCIEASLAGRHVLAQMPTGEGKSLVFQALAHAYRQQTGSGDGLVISPSTALSDDHMRNARELGLRAFAYHSRMRAHERNQALDAWRKGESDLLFISPEALAADGSHLIASLYTRPASRVTVDEAHLFQSWGLGFRPAYRDLRKNLEAIYAEAITNTPWVSLSATLTESAEADLVKNLKLSRNLFRYRGSVLRKNIRIRLAPVAGQKVEDYPRMLLPLIDQAEGGPIIIYTQYATDAQKLYDILKNDWGCKAVRYHAKPRPSEEDPLRWQQEMADKFRSGEATCMIATVAYGMGINLPAEVRSVALLGPPASVAELVQQIGRGGRRGSESLGTLLHSPSLLQKQRLLAETSWPEPRYLLRVLKNHATAQGQFEYVTLPGVPRDEAGELRVNDVGNMLPAGGQSLEQRSAVQHLQGLGLLEIEERPFNDPYAQTRYRVSEGAREMAEEALHSYQAHRNDAMRDAATMRRLVRNVAAGACAQEEILKAFNDPVRGNCASIGSVLCSSCDQQTTLSNARASARATASEAAEWLDLPPDSGPQVAAA